MTASLILARYTDAGTWIADPRAYTESDALERAAQLRSNGFRVRVFDCTGGRLFTSTTRRAPRDLDRERAQRAARADEINARRRELHQQKRSTA